MGVVDHGVRRTAWRRAAEEGWRGSYLILVSALRLKYVKEICPSLRIGEVYLITRVPPKRSRRIRDGSERAQPPGLGAKDRRPPLGDSEGDPDLFAGDEGVRLLHRAAIHVYSDPYEIRDCDACKRTDTQNKSTNQLNKLRKPGFLHHIRN